MRFSELQKALRHPPASGHITDLLNRFQATKVRVRLEGFGPFLHHHGVLKKVRGALGTCLLEGVCSASHHGACACETACAGCVLFAQTPATTVMGVSNYLAKPFVLAMDPAGDRDLIVSITLFGLAQAYVPDVRLGLVAALGKRIPWKMLAKDLGLFCADKPPVSKVWTEKVITPPLPALPISARLSFLTGLETNNTKASMNIGPNQFVERLLVRPHLAAPWFGMALQVVCVDVHRFQVLVDNRFDHDSAPRKSGRTLRGWMTHPQRLDLKLDGDLTELWPFLVLGEHIHIGRGAVTGLGRYVISVD